MVKEKENLTKAVLPATKTVLKEPNVPYPKAIARPTMFRNMTLTHPHGTTTRVKAKAAGYQNLLKTLATLLHRVLAHTANVLDTIHANAVKE
jgi:hypothetical protein